MIAGEETFPLRTSQTSIEVHRTASGCTPPPESEENTQVSAVPVRGWVPGAGGASPLTHPNRSTSHLHERWETLDHYADRVLIKPVFTTLSGPML